MLPAAEREWWVGDWDGDERVPRVWQQRHLCAARPPTAAARAAAGRRQNTPRLQGTAR